MRSYGCSISLQIRVQCGGAAIILNSGRCDDRDYCFSDFRNWLVFLGRDALFSVLDNPDLIANERLKENSDRLIFVGSEAYGKIAYYANAVVSEGVGSLCEVECQVEAHKILTPEWDTYSEEELESSYPRLWKKFGHCVRLFKQREYKRSQYEVQESEIKGLGCIYRGGRIWHKHFGEGVITHIFNYPGQYSTARIRFTDRLSSSFVFHDPDMFSLEAAKEENRGQATKT